MTTATAAIEMETTIPPGDSGAFDRLRKWGGETLVRDMIGLFATRAPALLAAARAGVRAGDTDAVERAAHTLKSNCAQVGAGRAARVAARLETLAAEGMLLPLPPLLDEIQAELDGYNRWLTSTYHELRKVA